MDCCLPFVRNNDQRHCARFFLHSWFDLFQCNRNLYSELTRSYIQVQNHFSDIYSQQIKCCTVPLHNLCYCKSCLPLESCMFSCTAYSQWNICWEVRLSYLSSVRGCLFVCLFVGSSDSTRWSDWSDLTDCTSSVRDILHLHCGAESSIFHLSLCEKDRKVTKQLRANISLWKNGI